MKAKCALIFLSVLPIGCDSSKLDESNRKLDEALIEIEQLKAEAVTAKAELVKKQNVAKAEIDKSKEETQRISNELRQTLAAKDVELKTLAEKDLKQSKEFSELVDKTIRAKKIRLWAAEIQFGLLSEERQAKAIAAYKKAKEYGPKSLDGWLSLLDGGTDEALEMAYIASGKE
jgi:hypothetical protein